MAHKRDFSITALVMGVFTTMLPALLYGQGAATGTFVGLIEDSTGAVVPGATVTARNLDTNISHTETTAEAGVFTIPNLPAGFYEIKATRQGFRVAVVPKVKLDVNATFRVNMTLQVGEVSETVQVTAAPPPLQTEEASVGHLIEEKRVVDLPLNGRNFGQLQLLSPGAVNTFNHQTASGLGGGAASLQNTRDPVAISSNGSRPSQSLALVDGVNVTHQVGRSVIIAPNPDEIQEFKIQGANFSAEYGYGSNVVNVSTKSGTNQLRGTVWEFLRNDKLDARTFFARSVEPLKRNQFGVSVGGPVVIPKLYNGRDRTFWYFNYEGQRERQGVTRISSVPTARMRGGDFSEISARIYDPDSTARNPAVPNSFTRQPFPGNVIPQNRLHPVGQLFLEWIPLPNLPGAANNFTNLLASTNDFNHYSARGDHRLNNENSLMFRLSHQRNGFPNALGPYSGFSKEPYDPGAMPKSAHGTSGVLGWISTISPTTVLDSRITFARSYQDIANSGVIYGGTDWTTAAGIQGFGPGISDVHPTFPELGITGYTGLPGQGGFGLRNIGNNWEYSTNLTIIRGKHSLKTGFSHRRYGTNNTTYGNGAGVFSFTGEYTVNPAARQGTGSSVADYMLQIPFNGSRYMPPGWFYRRLRNVWMYFQDDWKVSSKLTVNLGVRYEINLPTTQKRDIQATFSPNARNGRGAIVVSNEQVIDPVRNPGGQPSVPLAVPTYRPLIVTSSQVGLPERSLRVTAWKSFGPRVGFAYRVNDSTVVRSGFGLYFLQPDANREGEWITTPFLVREASLLNVVDADGRPTRTIQTLLPKDSQFSAQPAILGHDPSTGTFGYSQQWNLFVERSLPGAFVFDIGYVGNRGTKLQQGRELNAPFPGPGAIQPRRPWPDFLTITWNEQSGYSTYHALQTKLERRFHAGLTTTVSFAWSKSIDLNTSNTNVGFDPYNFQHDRGLADFDSPRILAASVVYELPFFRKSRGFTRQVLGGWTISSIITAQDGYPFNPTWSGDVANTGRGARPDRTCNGSLDNPTIARWFDTSCFVAPAAFTYGNTGRNVIRGPGYVNWDGGIYKDFALGEQRRLQFRSEFFNTLNHPNFGLPASVINAGTPGVITTVAPARIIQFAPKLYF